ncbi:MAG: hypothetical protein NZ902_05465 [Acidilobaceae archaeon]|nr:hypothetical protein [Acidilobaceae archaeon]MCX8166014.1 hypothetical protein [Acidilobaceae archaeon]MDW7974655.1 hypothetical protein [Sulfolobales archaeon]
MARPVYGNGFFHVAPGTIFYTIVFDYFDEGEYWELLRAGEEGREEERLREEMQRLTDQERTLVNGEEVRVRVLRAFVEARGVKNRSSAVFLLEIPYEPRPGVNEYENYYEAGVAQYSYTVRWTTWCGKIVSIASPGAVRIEGRVASIAVRKGTYVNGHEKVSFFLPEECLTGTPRRRRS